MRTEMGSFFPNGLIFWRAAPPYCCPRVYIACLFCSSSCFELYFIYIETAVLDLSEGPLAIRFVNC